MLEVELREILDGLILFQRRGLDRVIIQTDNLEMVKVIQDKQDVRLNSVLVRRIIRVLQLVGD